MFITFLNIFSWWYIMKILVTGAAGFIGYHLCKRLEQEGHEIIGVDNLNEYYDVNLKHERLKRLNITFHKLDLCDDLSDVFDQGIDCVVNLAAQAGVRYSIENPYAYELSNGQGFLNLLEHMRRYNVKRLVFASSSSVYGGNTKIPFSVKDTVDHPVSLYAATKKYNELQAHVYYKLYGIKSIGLRFFTVYGPWGRPDMAYYSFTKNIVEGKTIKLFNHGDHFRDFTYIDDIVEGILLSIMNIRGYNILNLGKGDTDTLGDFVSILEKHLNKKAVTELLPMQPGDVHGTYADITETKELLGWQPRTNLDEGLKHFVDWYNDYFSM